MSCINIIGEMVKADEEKSEIKLKLEEIRKIRTSFNIDVSRFRKMIDRDKLNQEEIERDNEKYKIIAKLSFDLFMDYEYYREFPIKNDSRFVNCAEELKSLGYELRESAEWVNVRRPNMDTIIDQIFLSHLCQSILTRCVCCDAITRDGQSECDKCLNEPDKKRIKTTAEEDNNESDKRKCESSIPLNGSICDNYSNCANENKIMADKCTNCYNCGSDKEIIGEGMCGDCYSARYNDWICQYKSCGEVNNFSDKYCKTCGIERSSVLISGVLIGRFKNGKFDKAWICGKCDCLNEINHVCCKCGVAMEKRSESMDKNHLNFNPQDKWICHGCKCVNDVSLERCQDCERWRIWLPWNCSRCNKRNDSMMKQCDICGEVKKKKYCVKCGWRELIMDGLCISCDTIRNSSVPCFNRLCNENIYIDKDYCGMCGLYRYDHFEHGAPIMRDFCHDLDDVWICFDCGGINKWCETSCQNDIQFLSHASKPFYSNRCLSRRDKNFKWCQPCRYKYPKSEYKCFKCNRFL